MKMWLGYRPNLVARSLRSQHFKMIGLIGSDVRNPFFTSISRADEDAAYDNQTRGGEWNERGLVISENGGGKWCFWFIVCIRLKCNVKKLITLQTKFVPQPCHFYLERCLHCSFLFQGKKAMAHTVEQDVVDDVNIEMESIKE